MGLSLRREEFSTLAGWADDSPIFAFEAFVRSARFALEQKPYRTGCLGLSHDEFAPSYRAALELAAKESGSLSDNIARLFFESWFRPVEICLEQGCGFVTGYYEPDVDVRIKGDDEFQFPFLNKPISLVKVLDPSNPPDEIPPGYAFMLSESGKLSICPDRQAIETGAFASEKLEIAWANSRVDVFFAHVQGCARLRFPGGETRRITYAAKSGHPFTGIGRLLVERGEILPDQISMASIRSWLADHADQAQALMWENRSFIFFRDAEVENDRLGPVAAAKVPLEPGRSMAVDRTVHTFGTPIFVSAPTLEDFDEPKPFARLMIAQDTGTAIVGPARGDLFTGSGSQSGDKAGSIKSQARFVAFVPVGSEVARRAGHER